MTDWPSDSGPVEIPGGGVPTKPPPPGEDADAILRGLTQTDDGTDDSAQDGSSGFQVPEAMRAAMVASGVDIDAVLDAAADEHVIPTDEEAAFLQAARNENGLRCQSCNKGVKLDDPAVLREITGWAKHRDEGGQNHVIDRRETGAMLCGSCGTRMQHGLHPQQEALL